MNTAYLLIITLQLTTICITGFTTDSVAECPDAEATGFDALLARVKSVTALNFSQIPNVLYGNGSQTSWLLLLYSPFGGHSLEYANEFGHFANMISRWHHTVKIAVLNIGTPAENAWSLHHYRVKALPALYFIPRRASWGATKAVQLPRDPVFLEEVLLSELETYVHGLKPVPSVSRVLRGIPVSTILYLEEAPDGGLSRRVVLDLLAVAPNVRVAWRGDAKLSPGLVRVASYRRVRGFRYQRRLNPSTVNSPGALAALIESTLNLNRTTLSVAVNASSTEQTGAAVLKSNVAVLCRADAALKPPGREELRADALRLLRVDLIGCLTSESSTANVWPAIVDFLRLLASVFRIADPSLSALATTLIHCGPRQARWRSILGSDTVESDVERKETWRLLHAMATAMRTQSRSLPFVIPTAHRLAQACPKARLPSLPPTVDGASSPDAEVLNLWWLHNQARGRVFPPPGLCPGCLPLQQKRDALRFLSNWYRAAVEAPVATPSTARSRTAVGLLVSKEDAMRPESAAGPDGRPCILQLIQSAEGGVDWVRLAMLLGMACACCAAILLLI